MGEEQVSMTDVACSLILPAAEDILDIDLLQTIITVPRVVSMLAVLVGLGKRGSRRVGIRQDRGCLPERCARRACAPRSSVKQSLRYTSTAVID